MKLDENIFSFDIIICSASILLFYPIYCETINDESLVLLEEFEPYELKCDESITYQLNTTWSKDGEWFGRSNGTLETSQNGVYECKACNSINCITRALWIYRHQKNNLRVEINTGTLLRCELSHFLRKRNVSHTVEWARSEDAARYLIIDRIAHDRQQTLNKHNNLLLKSVSYSDEGTYNCHVKSRFGKHVDFGHVGVVNNRQELLNPSHKFVLKNTGDMVEFRVKETENQPKWSKNNQLLNETGWSYRIGNLTAEDSGVYKVEYDCAEKYRLRCTFRFWLAVDSIFTKKAMQNTIVKKGEWGNFEVNCDTIFMKYSGINYTVSYNASFNEDDIDNHKFRISFIPESDSWYTCTVKCLFGVFNKTMHIKPIKTRSDREHLPVFKDVESKLGEAIRSVNHTAKLSCLTFPSQLETNTTWRKNGKVIKHDFKRLFFKNVTGNDTGEYECQACIVAGCTELTYWLLFGGLTKPVQSLEVLVNTDPVITCLNEVYPFVWNITWSISNSLEIPQPLRNRDYLDFTGHDHKLRFKNVTLADANTYVCSVDTYFGKFHQIINMAVVDELPSNTPMIAIVISCLILVTIIIIFIKLRRKPFMLKRITIKNSNDDDAVFQLPTAQIEMKRLRRLPKHEYEFPISPEWEIPRPVIGEILGSGHFGTVSLAEYGGVQLAVKKLKDDHHSDQDVLNFFQELEIMKRIGEHPNIIQLHGCCSQSEPLLIVVEYAPHGNLRDYLRKHRLKESLDGYDPTAPTLSVSQLIWFAHQVAQGMEFLASIKYLHRDLATRNVLVFEDDVIKISDFGLARNIQLKDYYRQKTLGSVPAAWIAPESLEGDFYNSQSEVWSFGVLFWEILTFGAQPYQGWTELLPLLKEGRRLEQPLSCSAEVYQLMTQCWRYEAEDRPTFSEIVQRFAQLNSTVITESAEESDIAEEYESDIAEEYESDSE